MVSNVHMDVTSTEHQVQGERGVLISVIVPVHNGLQVIGRCLEALRLSTYPNFEILVVDDCSTDATPQIIKNFEVQYFKTPRKMGPAGARNLGAEHAIAEILAFVDADVVLPPEALAIVAEAFTRDSRLAALFGSYDDEPECNTFISQYKNLMHHYVHQSSPEQASTFWAGCGAVRKRIFQTVGGFDETTYTAPSVEDIALGLELTTRGYPIRLEKRLTVKHLKRWTLSSLLRADIFARAVPWTRLILKSRQVPRDLNLNYRSRISAVLTGLLVGIVVSLPIMASVRPNLTSWAMFAVAATCAVLLVLNCDVYRFFWRKRGLLFAARAVAVQWVYYLYSGVTFVIVAADALLCSRLSAWCRNKIFKKMIVIR
jgi:glycosyltransferase involved in cell wall biosynthesis